MLADALEHLVSGIVDHPEDVEVTPRSMRRGQLLEVRVNPEDLGRVIEEVGYYDPQPNPSIIRIDSERAQYWLGVGAQPSDQVRNLLVLTGDIAKFNGKADAVSRVQVSEADKAAQAEQAIKDAEAAAEKSKAAASAKKAEEEAAAAAAEAEKSAEEPAGEDA